MSPLAAILLMLASGKAEAHAVQAPSASVPDPLAWSYEPWVILPLCLVGLCWLVGLIRLNRRSRRAAVGWRNLSFAAGWLVLGLSLASPLHAAGSRSFTAHMIEHELLILGAAPLLVAGRPAAVLLWGLPRSVRGIVTRAARDGWRGGLWHALTAPITATLVHGGLLWLWHLPALFDAAVRSEGLHALQHLSFLVSAALFWWAMFHVRERQLGYGIAVLAVFATAVHSTLLGALLTVLPTRRYAVYETTRFGLTVLEDQQLAGLMMWVPAGIVYVGIGLLLFALWMRGGDFVGGKSERVFAAG
jgi:putative membrane protein